MANLIYDQEELDTMTTLYRNGLGSTRIAREINKGSPAQVLYALKATGIKSRPAGRGRPQNSYSGIVGLRDLIDGILLGDGCLFPIRKPHVNSGMIVTQTTSRRGFLDWVQTKLDRSQIPNGIYHREKNNSDTLYTSRSTEFTRLRASWYPNGKKVPPSDLHLTPRGFMAWYFSDGTKHGSDAITLYTNSFSFTDAKFLADCLLRDLGLVAHVREHIPGENSWSHHPDKAVPTVYLRASQGRLAFGLMGECPIPSLSYKWPDQFSLAFDPVS